MTTKLIAAYFVALTTFIVVDLVWLAVLAKDFYRAQLGPLLAERPNLAVAAVFYLIYAVGLVVFAVMPGLRSGSALEAMALGALFGLCAYATYDLTNLATLKGWPVQMVAIDIIWGTVLSGVAAWVATMAARAL